MPFRHVFVIVIQIDEEWKVIEKIQLGSRFYETRCIYPKPELHKSPHDSDHEIALDVNFL